jgi:Xaa-Pro aminopeptidase
VNVLPLAEYRDRQQRLRAAMAERGIDAVYLSFTPNLDYVAALPTRRRGATETRHPGDWLTGALYTQNDEFVVLSPRMDQRWVEPAVEAVPWVQELRLFGDQEDPAAVCKGVVERLGLPEDARIAIDDRAWAETLIGIQGVLPNARFSKVLDMLGPMRAVKSEAELEVMRETNRIVDDVLAEIVPWLRVGMTEHDITSEVSRLILKHGGDGTSFESNIRALKQGVPRPAEVAGRRTTGAQLQKGGTVSFDFGATYQGYASDFGRTVFIGDPDPELLTCHTLIMDAQAAAMTRMKSGEITCQDADRTARGIIADGGYGQYFTHRLGHSIGKDMHETPWLIEGEETVLQTNMCYTVEPSIMLPGRAHIRVEDVVVVKPNGAHFLTTTGHDPIVVEG